MSTEQEGRVPRGGRFVVIGVWAAAGAAHLCAALFGAATAPVGPVPAVVLGVAGLAGAAVLAAWGRPVMLLVAAVVGLVGVAAFLFPLALALVGTGAPVGGWNDPWTFGAFLLDGLLVRLAAFTLRRTGRAGASPHAH